MNIRLSIITLAAALTLTACSGVNNATVSDAKLRERAAFTLGTSPDKVTISNRRNEGITIHFTATVGGRATQCYVTNSVTMIGAMTSDALCSDNAAKAALRRTGQCNDLLKAAGRC